ncbi:hypothetical protein K2Z84_18830 [Candidatus Binatia bacterium]|nr:hypothetical protein [Candidatus Binatia bacterium]
MSGPARDDRDDRAPWHEGRRHAIHQIVDATRQLPEARREALTVMRAFEAGTLAERPPDRPLRGMVIVNELIALEAIEAAKAYARSGIHGAADVDGLELLTIALEHLPPAAAGMPFRDDTARDFQLVRHPDPGRRPLILVFCGLAQRFAMPLNLAHRWFARLGAHVAYLRDLRRAYYLAGIQSLGQDYAASCAALRDVARSLDASGIVCVGNSAGTFGALSLGLDLQAAGVLCLSGPTRLDQSRADVERSFAAAGMSIATVPPEHFDLRQRFALTPRRPRVRHVHGAGNDVDRSEGENLAGIAGVELLPIAGWERHSVVEALIPSGAFDGHLRWLVGTTAAGTAG